MLQFVPISNVQQEPLAIPIHQTLHAQCGGEYVYEHLAVPARQSAFAALGDLEVALFLIEQE